MSKPKFIEELESFSGKTVVKVFVNKAFKIEQTYRTSDKERRKGE